MSDTPVPVNTGSAQTAGVASTPTPVLPAGQQSFFSAALAWLKTEADNAIAAVQNFVTHDAMPFLETFLQQTMLDEIAALKPLVESAIQEIAADLPAMIAAPGGFIGTLTTIVDSTLQQVEAAGLKVAQSSVVTAAQAGLQNALTAIGTQPAA